jgi:hypothetical protein
MFFSLCGGCAPGHGRTGMNVSADLVESVPFLPARFTANHHEASRALPIKLRPI